MARALSDDLRVRVVKASTEGLSARQAASRFGVGISTAIRWIARARPGETTARPQGRRRVSRLDAHAIFIVGLIEERKDITLNEMMARLVAARAVVIEHSALSAWLRSHGLSFKKDRVVGAPSTSRSMRDGRAGFRGGSIGSTGQEATAMELFVGLDVSVAPPASA